MTASHHFGVQELWITADAFGLEQRIRFRDHQCVVRFPSSADDFEVDQYVPRPDHSVMAGFVEVGGVRTAAAVGLIRVDVEMDGDLTADKFVGDYGRDLLDEATAILQESADIAREVVSLVVGFARVEHHQYWLEPQHQMPRVTWLSSLRDHGGQRLPVGYGDMLTVSMGEHHCALSAKDVGRILEQVGSDVHPPVAESLLADALFQARRAPHPNLHLGLLLAAIAMEVKIKETLRALSSGEQGGLVDLLLENPRDWSMAAASLFDKGLRAVVEVSLKDTDRELYKSVDLLFQHRNRYAHRGEVTLDPGLIQADLLAAQRAFRWLDELRAASSTDGG